MTEFFEIAYAAASNRLCIFTGTGFSKAVTGNAAPSWQSLLEKMCDQLADPPKIKSALFPASGKNPLSLEEAAQVIAIEMLNSGKSIHDEIAQYLRNINIIGDNSAISVFLKSNRLIIVTTNYDKLAEELAGSDECHSIAPGFPFPRSLSMVEVYHVHGSVDSPINMVVTSDDYFKFINEQSYFSKKLSTILHENTVVILGYSLADTNLKAILSDYRGFSRNNVISSNLFLISRSIVDQHIKNYYVNCYGVRVIDNIEIHEVFRQLNTSMEEARNCASTSIENIKNVLLKGFEYTENYLKVENSFYEIFASVAAIGRSINDPLVVKAIGKIIQKKIELTTVSHAWEQYEHLARWLIYLATVLELRGTSIEEIFLNAVLKSMTTMKREYYYGYSWFAYTSWSARWARIMPSNRLLIKEHIEANTRWPDALEIVRLG